MEYYLREYRVLIGDELDWDELAGSDWRWECCDTCREADVGMGRIKTKWEHAKEHMQTPQVSPAVGATR